MTDCNFCEDDLYSEHIKFYIDGREVIWDGWCRAGSRQYFRDLSAKNITDNVLLSMHVLGEIPEGEDDPIVLHQAEWIEDEVERAKRELLFRLEDGVHSTQKPEV